MKITYKQLIEILRDTQALLADVGDLVSVDFSLVHEADKEYPFLHLDYTDGKSQWEFRFTEEDNPEVELIGSSVWLKAEGDEDDDEPMQLTLLGARNTGLDVLPGWKEIAREHINEIVRASCPIGTDKAGLLAVVVAFITRTSTPEAFRAFALKHSLETHGYTPLPDSRYPADETPT